MREGRESVRRWEEPDSWGCTYRGIDADAEGVISIMGVEVGRQIAAGAQEYNEEGWGVVGIGGASTTRQKGLRGYERAGSEWGKS
jgi:hypothetical protein